MNESIQICFVESVEHEKKYLQKNINKSHDRLLAAMPRFAKQSLTTITYSVGQLFTCNRSRLKLSEIEPYLLIHGK